MEIENNLIFLANLINLVGVVFLLLSHTFISVINIKKGFLFSLFGGFFVSIGSIMLESYPIFILNVLWLIISIYGYLNQDKKKNKKKNKLDIKMIYVYLFILIILVPVKLYYNVNDLFAYFTTFIYISSYFIFALNYIKKESYLLFSAVGYLFIVFHLIEKMQYVVLLNETYGFIVSLLGLYLYYKKSQKLIK